MKSLKFWLAVLFAAVLAFSPIYSRIYNRDQRSIKAASINSPKKMHEFLEHVFDGKVIEFTFNTLTKPGDNYRGLVQKLDVKLLKNNHSNEFETLHLVCKTVRKLYFRTDPYQISRSTFFMKEIHFYSDILEAIKQFEEITNIPKNERIDAFARYFGSRLSLNPKINDSADADAILLMENVRSLGYVSPEIWYRLERDELLAALKQLAKLHALCIAMRRLQPTLYYSKVDPYLHTVLNYSLIEGNINLAVNFSNHLLTTMPNTSNVRIAIEKQIENCKKFLKNTDRIPDTPYTTIYHKDLWIKNIMIKRDQTEEIPIKVILLDYQDYNYNSFALDLVYFLFLNARIDDLRMNFKWFIDYYLREFVNILQLVDCPLNDYTYEKLTNEVKDKANLVLLYLYKNLSTLNRALKYYKKPASVEDVDSFILTIWKCYNDLYIENNFLSID